MRNEEKIKKHNSLSSKFYIKLGLWIAGLAIIAGFVWACGATFWTIAGIYLGYILLRLVLRLIGLVLWLVFTVIAIIILTAIISLLIF
ncbi:MAG: hypothetical protein LBH32_08655 [Dysgonamonadaceae bacterium]|nr:hypothetical protein [Dysgonamonadaceae bacterium]